MNTSAVRWACKVVWPALKSLVELELTDFGPLYEAVPAPGDEQRWHALVQDVEAQTNRLLDRGFSPQHAFILALKALNEEWFIGRGLLLCRSPDRTKVEQTPNDPWELVRVGVTKLERSANFEFADGAVRLHSVRGLFPLSRTGRDLPTNYDGLMEWVVIDHHKVWFEVLENVVASWGKAKLGDALRREGVAASALEADFAYHRMRRRRFSDPTHFSRHLWLRTLCEELRHAIDGTRVRSREQGPMEIPEYYTLLADTLLSPNGRLRAQVLAGEPDSADLSSESPLRYAISELSAQMTAAAVGPDPVFLILEWWKRLHNVATEMAGNGAGDLFGTAIHEPYEHLYAAAVGVTLLAEELQLADGFPLADITEPDFGRLASLAMRSTEQEPHALRLALKEIFEREFNHPVDEAPFPEITAAGTLRWRLPWHEYTYISSMPLTHPSEGEPEGAADRGSANGSGLDAETGTGSTEALPDIETIGRIVEKNVVRLRANFERPAESAGVVRKGTLSRKTISIELLHSAAEAGYRLTDCRYSRDRITGRIAAFGRPTRFPGLWCYLFDAEGRYLDVALVDVPDLEPGETDLFEIESRFLRKAGRVCVDLTAC